VSFTQKRKRKRPARARLGVSKTTSYDPTAGRTTPATGSTCSNESRYGFRSSGRAVSPTRRFSSPATTIRGITLDPLAWSTTAAHRAAGEDDEAGQIPLGRLRPDGRADRERARNRHRGRDGDGHSRLLRLLGDCGAPRAGSAARVGERHLPRGAPAAAEQAER